MFDSIILTSVDNKEIKIQTMLIVDVYELNSSREIWVWTDVKRIEYYSLRVKETQKEIEGKWGMWTYSRYIPKFLKINWTEMVDFCQAKVQKIERQLSFEKS